MMRVAVWSGGGMGGTEKAAVAFALGLRQRGYNIDFLGDKGARSQVLQDHGVRVVDALVDEARIRAYLEQERPAVVHQHVPGTPYRVNPLYRIWPEFESGAGPVLIETNVFGRFDDPDSARFTKFRMFVSMANGTQAYLRAGRPLDPSQLERHTILYNPVEPHEAVSPERRANIRHQLGILPAELLALRIGQISPKWTRWECEAFRIARRSCPALRLLLLQPPENLALEIRAGKFGDGIFVREATTDFSWLRDLYGASDLMVHATDTGESFGYTLAEAMASGLPLIVRTTPWGDNAQVELVENGSNGFVCASIGEMARRWVELATNAELRSRMAEAGRRRMKTFARLETELEILEAVLTKATTGETASCLSRRNSEWSDFARGFRSKEWKISEPPLAHPMDYLSARAYDVWRRARSRLSRAFKR